MKAEEIIEKIIVALQKDSQVVVKLIEGCSVVIESDIEDGISAEFYSAGKYVEKYTLAWAIGFVMCYAQSVVEVV